MFRIKAKSAGERAIAKIFNTEPGYFSR